MQFTVCIEYYTCCKFIHYRFCYRYMFNGRLTTLKVPVFVNTYFDLNSFISEADGFFIFL